MKKIVVLFIGYLVMSCNESPKGLLGTWRVDSKFYRANYKILEENDSIKALILYYNDDTTVLKHNPKQPRYAFSNLTSKKDVFVDAISGATKNENHTLSIKQIHKDTLKVTTYILNKALNETWIRTY